MHSRSSWANTATVRRCNSVPARKIRTAISLRFAAINFLMGLSAGVVAAADGAATEDGAGALDAVRVLDLWRGIRSKAAGFREMLPQGEGKSFGPAFPEGSISGRHPTVRTR